MSWINPPAFIRRFPVHGIAQHWVATGLWAILGITAAASIVTGGTGWMVFHVRAGTAACAVLLYHLLALVAAGIRHNVALEKVAFLPTAAEWRSIAGGGDGGVPIGKFSPEEKGDYLCILAWGILLGASGLLLRWPGRLGIPGPDAFGWLKAAHAGFGAALSVHVLTAHVPGRWLRAPRPFRGAMLTGKVPLEGAEGRAAWVADLVAAGILVPAPEEALAEEATETRQVRDLLDEGNRSAKDGRYADACAAFEAALALLPSYSQARFNLAVARMKEGRADLAADEFRQFIAADPFNPMAEKARELLESIAGGKGERPS